MASKTLGSALQRLMVLFLSNGIYLKEEEGHISLNWPEANGLNVVCLCYVYTPKAYVPELQCLEQPKELSMPNAFDEESWDVNAPYVG